MATVSVGDMGRSGLAARVFYRRRRGRSLADSDVVVRKRAARGEPPGEVEVLAMRNELETTRISAQAQPRSCGGCTACCHVVAVEEIGLKSFHTCPHVRTALHVKGPGCGVYATRPASCRAWRCMWLKDEAGEFRDDERPDRVGFVVDEMLDLIKLGNIENPTAPKIEVPAAQIWVLKGHEEAWRHDPAQAVILGLLDKGLAVIWRMHGNEGIAFSKTADGKLERSSVSQMRTDEEMGNYASRSRRLEEIYGRSEW